MSISNKNSMKITLTLLQKRELLSDILKRKTEYLAVYPNDQNNKDKKQVRQP
ncbi:8677_t:CDS:2 [Entrophospora sp. SA101]|nr:8677_t:CDS:2 [Entrophospora sp. SA101]